MYEEKLKGIYCTGGVVKIFKELETGDILLTCREAQLVFTALMAKVLVEEIQKSLME